MKRAIIAAVLAALTAGLVAPAAPAEPAPPAQTVSYDHHSLTVDGERILLWSGEFHYFRLPSPDLWRDVLDETTGGPGPVSLVPLANQRGGVPVDDVPSPG